MRFAIFFLVLFVSLVGVNLFVYARTRDAFGLSPRARRLLLAVLGAGLAAAVVGRALARFSEADLWRTLSRLGMTVELAVLVAFGLMALERLVALAARLFYKRAAPAPTDEPVLGRRELLSRAAAGSALAVGSSSALYGSLVGRHDYVIEEIPIRLARLPRTLDGFTIVQLSDIHLGTFVGEREVGYAVDLVKQASPDLIVLTGDHVDHDGRYAELLGALVRRLRDVAPLAAVPGNHDYYAGIEATSGAVTRAGGELLVNRAVKIGDRGGRIAIAGVDDVWARRRSLGGAGPDLARALRDVPDDMARVLLCHNPVLFPDTAAHVDLQLSGHTHGGQFNPGVRPAKLFLPFGYVAGRYERGEAQLYVNRGFGTAGPPARLLAAPEVTKIVLTG